MARQRSIAAMLIDDWRRGWRFWSVRLQALGLASGALLIGAPEAAVQIWAAIPPDIRTLLPPAIGQWLPLLFGLLAIAARFMRQKG